MSALDVNKLDLYGILDVSEDASEKELIKAYRKRALKCHPDKNPDNPNAAKLFHELSKALELLTDPAARAAYDKAQKAKKASQKRHRELDKKRQKLKEELEAREDEAGNRESDLVASRNLAAEIERLRKEGSKLLEKEQNLLKEHIKKGNARLIVDEEDTEDRTPKLKIKWKAKKGDETNGGYSQSVLNSLLHKYGDVLNLIVSSKRNGSAIVEFKDRSAATMAEQYEKGLADNPLTFVWLDGQTEPTPSSQSSVPSSSEADFESLVLHKMRQAEERKRLIEQMKNEDGDS